MDQTTTIVIRRPAKVATDGHGRSVWTGPVEEVEFELVSTAELELALRAASDQELEEITTIARAREQGLVARNRETGAFTVVTDAELEALQQQGLIDLPDLLGQAVADGAEDGEELSLVSTQALKQLLAPDDADESDSIDLDSGFDPYDHS